MTKAEQEIADRGFVSIHDLQTWGELKDQFAATSWVWPAWLPNGYLTMLASAPGIGKSRLALVVAKILAHGGEWPDGFRTVPTSQYIAWVETESGEPFHIERAATIGLNLAHVITTTVFGEDDQSINLMDDKHRKRITAIAHEERVSAVIVDSLSGGHSEDENKSAIGKITQWLSRLARDCKKPVLVVHHMTKGQFGLQGKPPTLDQVRGSGAITQHTRVVWSLDLPDIENPDSIRLACIKNNVAKRARPIMLGTDEQGRLTWGNEYTQPSSHLFADAIRKRKADNPTLTITQLALSEGLSESAIAEILKMKTTNDLF